jgi:hypothetical protein
LTRPVHSLVLAAGTALLVLGCSPGGAGQATAPPPVAVAPAPPLLAPATPAGSRAEGEAYQLALELPATAKAGEAAAARVVVTARGPYHVNRDYPMAFRPDTASTARFPGERVPLGEGAVRTACAAFPGEDCTVSAPLAFTAAVPGPTRLSGTVAFSVCNPDRCLIEKVPLAATVDAR